MFDLEEVFKELKEGTMNMNVDKEYTKEELERLKYNNDFLKKEFYILADNLEKTKFKDKLTKKYNEKDKEYTFFLDGIQLITISEDTINLSYCTGDLSKIVLEQCYEKNGIKELADFVEQYCVVFENPVPPFLRISRQTFITEYMYFLKVKSDTKNKINFNKLSKILARMYGEKIIKSGTKQFLTHITLKEKVGLDFHIPLENFEDDVVDDSFLLNNSLCKFIDNFCVVSSTILASQRISRKIFKQGYNAFCSQNNTYRIDNKLFNRTLKEKYGETFIKSNGIWYMSKIKFKDFK